MAQISEWRKRYFGDRPPVSVKGHTAIFVDDGIATGATVRAAFKALRKRKTHDVVLAVPVAPADAIANLGEPVDEIVCLSQPRPFFVFGAPYVQFIQVSDYEAAELLAETTFDPSNAKGLPL